MYWYRSRCVKFFEVDGCDDTVAAEPAMAIKEGPPHRALKADFQVPRLKAEKTLKTKRLVRRKANIVWCEYLQPFQLHISNNLYSTCVFAKGRRYALSQFCRPLYDEG